MAIIQRSYQPNPDLDALFIEMNGKLDSTNILPNSVTSTNIKDGTIVNADVSSSAGINMTKTDAATVSPKLAMNVQSLTTNALTASQFIQRGWTFVVGSAGADTNVKQVTLPVAYDDTNYSVMVFPVGTKVGADPTSVTDTGALTNNFYAMTPGTAAQSATAFSFKGVDSDGAVMAAANRFVFMWIAIGTKA